MFTSGLRLWALEPELRPDAEGRRGRRQQQPRHADRHQPPRAGLGRSGSLRGRQLWGQPGFS